jgi:ribosomal protein L32
MIRCQECGFTNDADTKVCKKCGSRMEAGADSATPSAPKGNSGGSNPTMIGGAASGPAWDSNDAPASNSGGGRLSNPTIVGGRSNMPAWDENSAGPSNPTPPSSGGQSTAAGNVAKCPSCGFYPLRNEVSAAHPCPNCGTTGDAKAEATAAPAYQPAASHQMQKAAGANKTMRLGDLSPEEEAKPEFKLTEERSQSVKEFNGTEVSVNRDNLDAGNMSISSQEHATFVFEDGKWYLNDKSSNGATFIQVNGKIELTEGTKILMGNRIYTFQSK